MTGTVGMLYDATPLCSLPLQLLPAVRALPPTEGWVNVQTLGVTADGKTNDTAAIQKAIDTHRVLYFPSGQ
jgi:polygalacturonase